MNILEFTLKELTGFFRTKFGKGLFHASALYRQIYKTGSRDILSLPEFAASQAFAEKLEKPRRQRIEVNVSKLDFFSKKFAGKTFIVPGKVLGTGELHKKVEVAAFSFSIEAEKKINQKGKAITLNELLKNNVKPSKVRILG